MKNIFNKKGIFGISTFFVLFFIVSFLPAHATGEVTVVGVTPSDQSVIFSGHIDPAYVSSMSASGGTITVVVGSAPDNLDIESTPVSAQSLNASGNFTDIVWGLLPGTTYYLNVYDLAQNVPLLDQTQSFTTIETPSVTIDGVTNITKNSADIQFDANPAGTNLAIKINYSTNPVNLTSPTVDSTVQIWNSTAPTGTTFTMGGLQSATKYYFNIVGSTDGEIFATSSFTTLDNNGVPVAGSSYQPSVNNCVPGAGEYCLIEPLPNLQKIDTTKQSSFGDYLNKLFNLAIGFGAVLAVIMIIIAGIQYMGTDSIFNKGEDKSKIQGALFGLLILLGSFIILKTINSDLLNLGVKPETVAVSIEGVEPLSPIKYVQITGQSILSESQYDAMAKNTAHAVSIAKGIPYPVSYCSMRVILQRESSSNPGAIGYDSDVPNQNILSRRNFIASGRKFSGSTFPSTSLVTDSSIVNDDRATVDSTENLNLDWRFSHGIGLTQVTCHGSYPGGEVANCPDGKTPKQLLSAQENLNEGGLIWARDYLQCGTDVLGAFKAYNSGSCNSSNPFTIQYASASLGLYNQCIASNPS